MADRFAETDIGIATIADDGDAEAAIENRTANMRHFLEGMRGSTAAEALRALRDAFPNASLAERIRALGRSRR